MIAIVGWPRRCLLVLIIQHLPIFTHSALAPYYVDGSLKFMLGAILAEFSSHQIPYHDAISSEGNPLKELAIRTEIVEGNLNLSFSPACPTWILKLAKACLLKEPSMRPTANHLVETIQRNLKTSSVKSSAILSKRNVLLRNKLGTRRKYHSEDYALKRNENQLDSNEKV
ncbi:hypothetical protein AC1031_022033 [Aphanomyces cochlioides]|nr:hypothetical protein AC1031_022033 [Aphanomyces cochlioides]